MSRGSSYLKLLSWGMYVCVRVCVCVCACVRACVTGVVWLISVVYPTSTALLIKIT